MTDSARRPGPIELLALGLLVAFLGWRGLSPPPAWPPPGSSPAARIGSSACIAVTASEQNRPQCALRGKIEANPIQSADYLSIYRGVTVQYFIQKMDGSREVSRNQDRVVEIINNVLSQPAPHFLKVCILREDGNRLCGLISVSTPHDPPGDRPFAQLSFREENENGELVRGEGSLRSSPPLMGANEEGTVELWYYGHADSATSPEALIEPALARKALLGFVESGSLPEGL